MYTLHMLYGKINYEEKQLQIIWLGGLLALLKETNCEYYTLF